MLRGIWLCAEAIPLETNNAAAANMAEYFLMTNAGRLKAFRNSSPAHAKFPRLTNHK